MNYKPIVVKKGKQGNMQYDEPSQHVCNTILYQVCQSFFQKSHFMGTDYSIMPSLGLQETAAEA